MKKLDPTQLVNDASQIASLPEIYFKVTNAILDPKTSNKYLADIISEDTALSARLLRLANSSFYNFPSKIENITQAIIVIGTHQLRDVVLASSIVNTFKNIPENFVNMLSFWRHSIACGVTCRILSTLRRDANIETAFVSGLLHDIGQLILFKQVPEMMNELFVERQKTKMLLHKLEEQYFSFNHGMLGGLLLQAWKLPMRHVETTMHHHNPTKSTDYQLETATVHIADIIANSFNKGSSGEIFTPTLDNSAWNSIGLCRNDISMIVDELENQYSVAVEFVMGPET